MSYILDALRKSDQQRQHARAPTLQTARVYAPALPDKPAFSLNTFIAIALIGAGILIGWLQPWQTKSTPAIPPQPAPVATTIKTPTKPATKIQITPPAQEALPKPTLVVSETPQEIAASEKITDTRSIEVVPERKVILQSELPATILQEMPNLLIAFHQFSSQPSERRAMINNEVLRPGDQISPGLMLEQITPDGVILSYKGYYFKRGVR